MKSLILYFTGTYNTRYLANKLKERLIDNKEVTLFEVNSSNFDNVIDLNAFDNIFISYPIYAFNIPSYFYKYLKKLIFIKGKKYFIFKNSGETFALNDVSSRRLIRLLKRKGISEYSEYHFVMPYNIHFKFDDQFLYQCLKYNEKLMEIMLYDLKNNIYRKNKNNIFYVIAAYFLRIQSIGGTINSYFYKVDKAKCNKCQLCINTCPIKNIYINKKDKIKFKHNCLMCMRCSFNCPKNAINIGFLEGWKVNKPYDFKHILDNEANYKNKDYLKDNNEFFYKCFKKSFKEVDELYEETIAKKV